MEKKVKTNAMRMLDKAGISYETREYTCDGENFSGELVARQVGMDCSEVYKTLVVRGERKGVLVCCIPVDCELDLKAVAVAAGDKRVEMTHVNELLGLTGYIRGGCSPIGMKKRYPTFIEERARQLQRMAVSGGIRGEQLLLSPGDLIKVTGACYARLIK
jgi:Cys-tRNA(Pro)/Cys-tRNA(Cys) deacylase